MKTMKEYMWDWDGVVLGQQAMLALTSHEAELVDGSSVLGQVQETGTIAAYVIAMAAALYCVSRLSRRSSLIRILRVSSSRSTEIGEAIAKATGRKAVQLGRKNNKGLTWQPTLRLEIYRLEEVMLYDLIRSIDEEAEIETLSVTSLYGEQGK
jgi:hypothetical protein